MSLEEKFELLEEVMDVDEGSLSVEMELSEIDEWDSLAALSLITEMKSRFKMELTTQIIKSFKTVGDICNYIPD